MIRVINLDRFIKQNKLKGPITSPQIFQGKQYAFHPDGLFSEDIFGMDGSTERAQAMSWIDLNCKVVHPVLYNIIRKRIEKKVPLLLSGEYTYDINPETGALIENEDGLGELDGFESFIENINKIKFRRNDEEGTERNKLIEVIEEYKKKNMFFIDRLLVISPSYRNIFVDEESGRVSEDALNDIYKRIISLSHQVDGVSGTLKDILSYQMQLRVMDVYDYIESTVSKKHGLIRNMMLGKRVEFSARSVITPNPELPLGTVGVPLRICCEIFSPYLIYGVMNSSYSNNIPEEFHKEVKQFLGKEIDVELSGSTIGG